MRRNARDEEQRLIRLILCILSTTVLHSHSLASYSLCEKVYNNIFYKQMTTTITMGSFFFMKNCSSSAFLSLSFVWFWSFEQLIPTNRQCFCLGGDFFLSVTCMSILRKITLKIPIRLFICYTNWNCYVSMVCWLLLSTTFNQIKRALSYSKRF